MRSPASRLARLAPAPRATGGDLLETALIGAVGAVLGIRAYLAATGYPQVGGGGLHIAHMLWGGVLMLVALGVALAIIGAPARRAAALLGGVGFGIFIDEVGKFVTSDNDYFFRPAVSIIYVCFVLIFLVARAVGRRPLVGEAAAVSNALEVAADAAQGHMARGDGRRALGLLRREGAGHPLARALSAYLEESEASAPEGRPGPVDRARAALDRAYSTLAARDWFARGLVGVFAVEAVLSVVAMASLVGGDRGDVSMADAAQLASGAVSALLVGAGAALLRRSRLRAYRMLERSVLVSILFGQVFALATSPLAGLIGLLVDLALLGALRAMMDREEGDAREAAAPSAAGA